MMDFKKKLREAKKKEDRKLIRWMRRALKDSSKDKGGGCRASRKMRWR